MRNIRLKVAFDGTAYSGWQIQPNRRTVQGVLRDAIDRVTSEKVKLVGSGRTDAGTHARALVSNFMCESRIPVQAMVRALNSVLPQDIRVLSARLVPAGFHAQRDACSKTYRYQIYRGPVMPPHLAREHFHYPFPLNVEVMIRAAGRFCGRHDFASFAAKSDRRPPPAEISGSRQRRQPGPLSKHDAGTHRRVFRSELKLMGYRLLFTVEGNGFLRHMVRNMVGTLLEVGRGRMTIGELTQLFGRRDRSLAGFTAPAHGLILVRVRY